MFRRLLIANRGEIACRIARTARRMGLTSIAVYSDADAAARHVRMADLAVRIGPPPAGASYLNVEALMAAARATGAEAVHPGYGFLAESARFARACAAVGLIFVGPGPEAIESMGVKSQAKVRARAAGVPVLPGYAGERQDLAHLEAEALAAGLPLMIKPAAGGGGKGMHVVHEATQLRAALAAARRLAESSFGDGALLIERFVPAARHVEVQVLADAQGHCIHLGDRDCSIQRRHQKLIEEAPAPGLPEPLRTRLRTAAVQVARAVGYCSAGTVEFLYDGREFYFLEMNTRLQVEHTVTEAVTGLDLVEWQLRIAAGDALPFTQEQIDIRGHAIEARVCAEDPVREFLPSAGVLRLAEWPNDVALRVDAGFDGGDTVPDAYDSLLAKMIVWAPERSEAARALAAALEHTHLAGVRSNERWLSRILRSDVFMRAQHSVATLAEHAGAWLAPDHPTDAAIALAALLVYTQGRSRNPWSARDGFTPNLMAAFELEIAAAGMTYRLTVQCQGGEPSGVLIAGGPSNACPTPRLVAVAELSESAGWIAARLDALYRRARYLCEETRVHLWFETAHHEFELEDARTSARDPETVTGGLTTPLPGVVVAVNVAVGQAVCSGETLMVIEAMKMEHIIRAPFDGRVTAIHFQPGERVPQGSDLLALARAGA